MDFFAHPFIIFLILGITLTSILLVISIVHRIELLKYISIGAVIPLLLSFAGAIWGSVDPQGNFSAYILGMGSLVVAPVSILIGLITGIVMQNRKKQNQK